MVKRLLLTLALTAVTATAASATPITGSFSLASFGGTYIGGTAQTATGLDFGDAFSSSGNGYGTNGTALVGNATGDFSTLAGTLASISDISLGTTANPYLTNPFISFTNSLLALNFSDASLTRSSLGTSVTITGLATFTDGIAADTTTGMFSLAASSQNGQAASQNFTFTSNASTVAATPEPSSLALLGTGVLGVAGVLRRRFATA